MNQNTLISLSEIVPTKSNMKEWGQQLTDVIKSGNMNPLEFQIKSKFLKETLDMVSKDVSEDIIEEIKKHGSGSTYLSAVVEVVETGVKYDYSHDEVWSDLESQIKPLLELQKKQEERIRTATKMGCDMVDTDSGEIVARRVIKTSITSPKITLGK